jgi:hypothetical protein
MKTHKMFETIGGFHFVKQILRNIQLFQSLLKHFWCSYIERCCAFNGNLAIVYTGVEFSSFTDVPDLVQFEICETLQKKDILVDLWIFCLY